MSIWHGPAPQQIGERAMGGEFLRRRRCNAALPLALEQAQLPRRLAFDAFIESYTPKSAKAADCLAKNWDTLLAFYDFPAAALETPADYQSP